MPDFLNVTVTGMEDMGDRLTRFEEQVVSPALTRICDMLVDEYKKYPDEKRVTRKQAFGGNGFFSDKQRRWFFANLRSGELELPYNRTRRFERSWNVSSVSNTEKTIKNAAPYSGFVMGGAEDKTGQSRMQKLIGWKKVTEIMTEKLEEMRQIFNEIVEKWR